MKQKIISALFLSGTMLVSNFAFAESVPETATTTTVTESVAAATEESEPTKWEKVLEKLPKLSGYLQTGWNYNSVGDGSSSFQAKRLRLIMDGNVVKNVSFRLQIEAFNGIAGSTNGNGQKNLQVMDAFVTAKISKAFQVRVGQYYLPLGYENYDLSPSTLETVDFSNICYRMVCRNAIGYDFVDYGRDLGIMAFGDLFTDEARGFSRLSYNLSLSNGHLPMKDDNNKSKDIVAALTFRPTKFFNIKASYNWGEYKGTVNDESFNYQPMNRVIVGAWYNDPKGLDLRAEYGHIGSSKDGRDIIKEDGFYALAGWHAGKFLPVVRYDFYRDKVNDSSLNNYDRILLGLTYNPCNHVKIQANYCRSFYSEKAKEISNNGKRGSDQIQLMGVFYF